MESNNMNKNTLKLSFLFIVSITLLLILSCSSFRSNNSRASLCYNITDYVTITDSLPAVPSVYFSQLDNQLDYFESKGHIFSLEEMKNYCVCYPHASVRFEIFDIRIKKELLNYFTIILTKKHSGSFALYIKQDSLIPADVRDIYFIYQMALEPYLTDVGYDLYCFYNDSLVSKTEYTSNVGYYEEAVDNFRLKVLGM